MANRLETSKGMLALVLHAHLPFVRHPEHERFLEEKWLYEALSETYLPLLRVFRGLEADGVPFRLTISLSPTLTAMFEDQLLQERYVAHLDRLLELGDKELARLAGDEAGLCVVEMYRELLRNNREDFLDLYEGNVINGFRHFHQTGHLELITTTATHAFLPMYREHADMIRNQVLIAIENHDRLFKAMPEGIWLPECGYFPGLEEHLKPYGIKYFFSSAHGVLHADERPEYGVYAPVRTSNGVAVFGRDRAACNAIWSSEDGFPGHPDYRDFYRDIGFDLPEEYIAPYAIDAGNRVNTGFKYHAITGATDQKVLYDPAKGTARAHVDAETFLYNRIRQSETLSELMDRPPVIVAPFDAELFGHWWFEGPQFLDAFFRKFHSTEHDLVQVSPSEYLHVWPHVQVARPAFSSWGDKGYGQVWLDGSNDWIYRHTHKLVERMRELVDRFPNEKGLKLRTLNQAARELLLSQASDWPFIIKTGTTVPYAERRIRSHIHNFNTIYESLCRNTVKTEWLTKLEKRNNIFSDIDYRVFGDQSPLRRKKKA
ncbi:MAG: DUF1957 domain-containing protein [Spirochaetales bacterium]|nr:DUF1957 domain-containing protein [Spirochaetales bacterium]